MSDISSTLLTKLHEMAEQFDQIERDLADPDVVADHQRVRDLSVRRAALAGLVEQYQAYQALAMQVQEHEQIIADDDDADLTQMARAELPDMQRQMSDMLDAIANELVTADDRAVGSVMLELRAGAGGAEAGIWARDLMEMYQRYAATKKWKFDVLELSAGEQGGVRQAVINVRGEGVWQELGYEGGVHCVKRVPVTEAQGRVHTSTATVAVLPEPQKVQINIPEADVQEHITTAQGPGGQNVNKVATAVHLIHQPTGIDVRMQESKSQAQNREKAWALLRARVFDHFQREKDAERAESRSKMIGSADRSERIRTYRWKESVAVDHRLNQSFGLQSVMGGGLDPVVEALAAQDRAQRLAAL